MINSAKDSEPKLKQVTSGTLMKYLLFPAEAVNPKLKG
jgi:hypothetical protein